jgi:hypothetical protein
MVWYKHPILSWRCVVSIASKYGKIHDIIQLKDFICWQSPKIKEATVYHSLETVRPLGRLFYYCWDVPILFRCSKIVRTFMMWIPGPRINRWAWLVPIECAFSIPIWTRHRSTTHLYTNRLCVHNYSQRPYIPTELLVLTTLRKCVCTHLLYTSGANDVVWILWPQMVSRLP